MFIRNLLFTSVILFSSNTYAISDEDVSYGYKLLQKQYSEYTEKVFLCDDVAKNELLPDSVINTLKVLPDVTADGVSFLSMRAKDQCTQPEYSELMRVLLMVEATNLKNEHKEVSDYIFKLKKLMFSVVFLTPQKKFDQLPTNIKNILSSMEELKKPFNMMDVYDRVWAK